MVVLGIVDIEELARRDQIKSFALVVLFLEMSDRYVQDLVDDRCGHRVEGRAFLRRQLTHARQGFFTLQLANLLELVTQRDDGWDGIEAGKPFPERVDLSLDDDFGLLRLARAFVAVAFGDAAQIIDVVQVHVIDVVDRGIEVARHAHVDEKHGPVLALLQDLLHEGRGKDVLIGRRRADDHICYLEVTVEVIEGDRCATELARQLDGVIEGAVGHDHAVNSLYQQMSRGELAHRAGAYEHGGLVFQTIENFAREIDGGRTHGHRLARHSGLRTHALGNTERSGEATSEDVARRADRGGAPVEVFELP